MSEIHNDRILAFIESYQKQHQVSPTYREIGAAVGIPSLDHVSRDLHRLAQQGRIVLTPRQRKSIAILNPSAPQACLTKESARSSTTPQPEAICAIPLRGHCHNCGILSPTILCDECQSGAPLIQYHTYLGDARFCQNASLFQTAPTPEKPTRRRIRRNMSGHRVQRSGAKAPQATRRKGGRDAHVNSEGVKICAKCEQPRVDKQPYCRKHINEARMESYHRKKAERQAADLHKSAERIKAKYNLP